jgi:uncharacterized membrane protein YfcA
MLITAIVFLAVFTQSLSGFGLALVSMPLLIGLIGLQTATPLMALVGIVAESIMLLYYRDSFNLRAVAGLTAAAVVGIPLGLVFLRRVDEGLVTAVLGLILILYALYALVGFKLPQLAHPLWAIGFGFIGGIIGGAYNTSGPPAIIYGTCRRWSPLEFKSNLQGFFVITSVAAIASHALAGNFTLIVWHDFLLALPGIALGLIAGFSLDKIINPQRFRQLILILLIILGIRLIL